MIEINDVPDSAGPAANVNVPPIGPLESRRARRERAKAAEASPEPDLPIARAEKYYADDLDDGFDEDTLEAPLVPTVDGVTDDLAVARERKQALEAESMPASYGDLST